MSKEAEIIAAVKQVIADIPDPELTVTTVVRPVNQVSPGTVMVFADGLDREEINEEAQRWLLKVVILIRSELVSETEAQHAQQRMLDDVRAVINALDDAELLKSGSELGIEEIRRQPMQCFYWPTGDPATPAGGITALEVRWKE